MLRKVYGGFVLDGHVCVCACVRVCVCVAGVETGVSQSIRGKIQ